MSLKLIKYYYFQHISLNTKRDNCKNNKEKTNFF